MPNLLAPVSLPAATSVEDLRKSLQVALNKMVTAINSNKLLGDLDANGNQVRNLGTPVAQGDAVSLGYMQAHSPTAATAVPTTPPVGDKIIRSDGISGVVVEGYGGVRLTRTQGGGSEAANTLLMAGGMSGSSYFENILLGPGNVSPQTGATIQIDDLVNNVTSVDIIGGSSQGMTALLRLVDNTLAVLLLSVSPAGDLLTAGGFGCNGKPIQVSAMSGGAVATTAATQTSPYGFTTAAQANGIVTLLNTIQAALVANGIMS